MKYDKNNKLRLFEICAGYGSQALALNRLREIYPDFDYELVGWAEFDPEPDANPDIDKMLNSGISNSACYKLAGNSIVVDVMTAIFDKLFINTEQPKEIGMQLTLF